MNKDLNIDKEAFIRLVFDNIEYNSSSPERAKDYLESEGINVDAILAVGMKKINELLNRYKDKEANQNQIEKRTDNTRSWSHPSVRRLIKESGNSDPIDEIKARAKKLVLDSFELGWIGPPFSPIHLAKFKNIDVIPNDAITDACIVPQNNNFQIQYNPVQRQTRINFSIAHEIAHTLFSDCAESIRNREEIPMENRELEQLCNAAAAEIQLPYAYFSNDANSFEPAIEDLIKLATKYQSSLESVFLRYTEVVDKPCAVLIGIFKSDSKIVIDYHKSSRSFPIELPNYIEIPEDSKIYECTSPGWSAREDVRWDIFGEQTIKIQAVGISPYRRDNKPRVGILVLPSNSAKQNIDTGKVALEWGDATKPRGKGKKIIVQIVNTSAALGRGFGYSLSKNYPIVKEELQKWRFDKKSFVLGNSNLVKVDSNLYVFQMLAQQGLFSKGTEIPLRYNELRKCLIDLRVKALELGCSVHMPTIGAGQAKGNWQIIIGMIHDELVNYNVKVNIYFLPGKPIEQHSPSNITYFKEDSTWESGKLF